MHHHLPPDKRLAPLLIHVAAACDALRITAPQLADYLAAQINSAIVVVSTTLADDAARAQDDTDAQVQSARDESYAAGQLAAAQTAAQAGD